MNSFIEYMWYLMLTPFKKVNKECNQWYIFCKVIGKKFDEYKEDMMIARDETMLATCSDEMLQEHGADRKLYQYTGETYNNYRMRLAKYEEVKRLGGTKKGVLLAVSSLGFSNPLLMSAKEYKTDSTRWSDFYVILHMNVDDKFPVSLSILQKEVRRTKQVGSMDFYSFLYETLVIDNTTTGLTFHTQHYRHKIDGTWKLDSGITLDELYEYTEGMEMAENVITLQYRKKMTKSRINGILPAIKYIALGDGAEMDGTIKPHLKEDVKLFHEIYRSEYSLAEITADNICTFTIKLSDNDLVGEKINEIALYDTEGDVVLFSSFLTKIKENVEDSYIVQFKC